MCAVAAESKFEVVHFVEGFVDGVLNGTANYRGAPHHFELRAVEPNAAEIYELTPLSEQVFNAVNEAWQIWQRWERAQRHAAPPFAVGIPALPEDRERQAELRGFISNWLAAAKGTAFFAEGDFEQVAADAARGTEHAQLLVKWSKLG